MFKKSCRLCVYKATNSPPTSVANKNNQPNSFCGTTFKARGALKRRNNATNRWTYAANSTQQQQHINK